MDRLDTLSLGALTLVMAPILAATQWGFQVFWYAALAPNAQGFESRLTGSDAED